MRPGRRAFARLVAANPVRPDETVELAPVLWEEVERRLASVPPPVGAPRRRFGRAAIAAVVVAALAAVPAVALARTVADWLAAEPAPPEVVEEFGRFTPQLGFDPEPGKAVLVARDEGVRLYVTTNRQGTWCFVLSTRADGGTCVRRAVADAAVAAGYVSDVAAGEGQQLRVVVGRIRAPEARTVRFAAPDGTPVERRLGAGGFFVAGLRAPADESVCGRGDWAPRFTFRRADGTAVAEQRITLALRRGSGSARVCNFGFFAPPPAG